MYQGGYSGKILQINPTGQTVNKAELPLEIFQNFIGDAEFEIKDIFDEYKAGSGPSATDHPLNFSPGPFFYTTIPYAGRMAFSAELPLTDTMVLAFQGGYFPVEFKYAVDSVRGVKGQGKHCKPRRCKNGNQGCSRI
jgi:aldehyde:ferredoxin oxidoreductase